MHVRTRRVIGAIATAWPGISTGRIVVVIFVLRFVYNKTAYNRLYFTVENSHPNLIYIFFDSSNNQRL